MMECMDSGDPAHGMVMQQMVPKVPIRWWTDTMPHSVIGDVSWEDTDFSIDFRCTQEGGSAMVGVRASLQGIDGPAGITAEDELPGLWFSIGCSASAAPWQLAASVKAIAGSPFASGTVQAPVPAGSWHRLRLQANGSSASGFLDASPVFSSLSLAGHGVPESGWAGFGVQQFGHHTQFDNLAVVSTSGRCSAAAKAAGSPVAIWPCSAASPGQVFSFSAIPGSEPWGLLSLQQPGPPELCVAVSPEKNQYGSHGVVVAACNASLPEQRWALNANSSISTLGLSGAPVCLDVTANDYSPQTQLDVYGCQGTSNQRWKFAGGLLTSGDPEDFFCAGACL